MDNYKYQKQSILQGNKMVKKHRNKPLVDHNDYIASTMIKKPKHPYYKDRRPGYKEWYETATITSSAPKVKKPKKRW